MFKNTVCLVFALLCFFLDAATFAQNKEIKSPSDSTNAVLLSDYKKAFDQAERQRMADSIKKSVLQEQLASKKDAQAKEALVAQIDLLERQEKEARRLQKKNIDSLRFTAKKHPVLGFFNDTLFVIYNRLGSFSAADRAQAISKRIAALGDDFSFKSDSLAIADVESVTELSYGETILVSITEDDALWNDTTRPQLAAHYKKKIAAAVAEYRSETSVTELLKEIGMALALLTLLFAIIFYMQKLFRWTEKKIVQQKGQSIKSLTVSNYTVLDAHRLTRFFLFCNTILKWILILVLIYISLPILFAIFPWTSGLADKLLSYFLNPIKNIGRGLLGYLPKLITIVVIVTVFHYIIKLFRYFKNEIKSGALKINGFYPDWADPSFQIIRVLLYAFMFTVIFPYLPGSDSPVFRGVSVFLGVLFTFGSSGSLSNLMSGLVLTYMRAFKIGDRVKIGDITGDVIEKTLLVTRIRTIKNEIISVPNSNVMGSHTINYSSDAPEKGLILHTTVTIGYDVPWKNMYDALIAAALRTEHILSEPKPFVLQTGLEDFYVSYQLNAFTREPGKQATIYSELHQNIQDCCNEAGIEIMSPHYRSGRDGSTTTIPESYWKDKP
ncbi:mechanosensitive ion channel family protein [Flavobacterium caeni]|uniref:Small-conductance mechanosensitive channel n=1 Tax=Flavobacterium caeni TaxID=490189 RepID=A0A1G5K9X5_9FLAO|nr:mechanosensitive ion channel family protein [Flavobacterium caeni]SCY96848.1 Small-conductance mechanosensitive channel [Flavobacterium caeni]